MLRSGLCALTLRRGLEAPECIAALNFFVKYVRAYAAAATGRSTAFKGKHHHPVPNILPFSRSPADALSAFKQYQKDALFKLHAGNLLKEDYSLEPAFLPFYLFEATVSVEVIATLGRKADKSRKDSPLVWSKMTEWKQTANQLKLEQSEWCMQVYASYRLRRDLAEAAKPLPATLAALSKTLTPQDIDCSYYTDPVADRLINRVKADEQGTPTASGSPSSNGDTNPSSNSAGSWSSNSSRNAAASGASGYSTSSHSSRGASSSGKNGNASTREFSSSNSSSRTSNNSSSNSSSSSSTPRQALGAHQVPLDPPDMRQSIAWQLCHRQMMHQQILAAANHLKQTMSADAVRDLHLRLTVHSRSARLAYFPAYHLWYVHGEKYTPSRADIVPAEYDALIGGGPEARVAAELHPSPMKSRAAAAAAVAGVGLGAIPLAKYALGVDLRFATVAGADAVFLAFLAATSAGVIAARLPLMARNKHAAEQVEADRKFYRQFDQRESAHGAPPDEHTLWLWKDADWRRWEQEDRWHWQPKERQAWAESLFRQQAQREIDRLAAAKQQEQQSQQREEEEKKEAQREQKFGRSRHFTSHHHDESGAGARINHQQASRPRRRRDFLGYYKALGINLEEASLTITAEYIKSHYKAAALKLHPDKHVHADEATQKRAAERFRRLQLAYETLRDNDKRRAYDQGRLVQ